VTSDMARRPFATCLCAIDKPCSACPLVHACSCGSNVGQRCRRPSGHRGNFVMTHEYRLLRSDADAIARNVDDVQARLRAQRRDVDAMRAWARALRALLRHPTIWRGMVDPTIIERLLALTAGPADHDNGHEQLTLL
jgi:hypothetical protein